MVLARPEGGADGTCGLPLFLLPRTLPDGTENSCRILRLKEKMGTRSMASGEIALDAATTYLVGDPGQGFKQMTDMISTSRLTNGGRSAGLMRRSVSEVLFISRNPTAFGQRLIDLPLMRRQLIEMLVTAEQGRSMVFRTAQVLHAANARDGETAKMLPYVAEKAGDTTVNTELFGRAADLLETVTNDHAAEADVSVAATAVYNATSAEIMI